MKLHVLKNADNRWNLAISMYYVLSVKKILSNGQSRWRHELVRRRSRSSKANFDKNLESRKVDRYVKSF